MTDYMKAVDILTINVENKLIRKVERLEIERTEYQVLAAELAQIKKQLNMT